jgi:hypothetical protein
MITHTLIDLTNLINKPRQYTSISALANELGITRSKLSKWREQAQYKLFKHFIIHFDVEILRIEGKRGGLRVKGQGNVENTGDWGC